MYEDVAVIVPSFNEYSSGADEFYGQMEFFSNLSNSLEVNLIDDGSCDGSRVRALDFLQQKKSNIRFFYNEKNGQKVGAIKLGLQNTDKKYVLLTDFDSRVSLDSIQKYCAELEKRADVSTIGFRPVPTGKSLLAKFQDLEYAIGAVSTERHQKKFGGFRFASGTGALWKRKVLEEIINEHSGRFVGEDAEFGMLSSRHGYKTLYASDMVVETRVPESILELLEQRKRWNAGHHLSMDEILKKFNPVSFILYIKDLSQNIDYLGKKDHLLLSLLYPFYKVYFFTIYHASEKNHRATN